MSTVLRKMLFGMQIKTAPDVSLARRRARQIAVLLSFDSQDQTRISTAVSEIARNALLHAAGGRLDFYLLDKCLPFRLVIELTDKGPGIKNIDQILAGKTKHLGLVGTGRLVDKMSVTNLEPNGLQVQLEKELGLRTEPFTDAGLCEFTNSLNMLVGHAPIDEMHQQNQLLLSALDQLSQKQLELDTLNLELAGKNRHLSNLNHEMQSLNDTLEEKVEGRTRELIDMNKLLEKARDEAVLANRLKSQFVANISHEIRTPMNGILCATALVLEDCTSLDEQSIELIRITNGAATGLMIIINDLLDFAKLESGKQELKVSDFSVSTIIEEVINNVAFTAKEKSLPIYGVIAESLRDKVLSGDRDILKRVFLNLVHNAVKFTKSGEVRISVDIKEQHGNAILLRSTVADTGIGIAESDKKRLFQPFVQADGSSCRDYGGTGLGLSISNGYVDLLGGRMGFQSTKDKGSEFWFEVPFVVAFS